MLNASTQPYPRLLGAIAVAILSLTACGTPAPKGELVDAPAPTPASTFTAKAHAASNVTPPAVITPASVTPEALASTADGGANTIPFKVPSPTTLSATTLDLGDRVSQLPSTSSPSRLVINAINVDVPLARLGLKTDGALEVPANPDDVGWWRSRTRVGPTVIVGHVDSQTGPAVFYRLPQLSKGDHIEVRFDDADGPTTRTYIISGLQRVRKTSFPTAQVYRGFPDDLRLVTCGGSFDEQTGHYLDNVIVFATPVV